MDPPQLTLLGEPDDVPAPARRRLAGPSSMGKVAYTVKAPVSLARWAAAESVARKVSLSTLTCMALSAMRDNTLWEQGGGDDG